MICTRSITVKTQGNCDIIDITSQVQKQLIQSKVNEGIATLFISGSTAALTTVEYEPGLIQDLKIFFEKIIPAKETYHHDETWHDGNGHAHVRSSLLKTSLSVPFKNATLLLGTWQQIVLIDFDNRSRNREVVTQFMGE